MPRWVVEGLATYMVGSSPDEETRLMRELIDGIRRFWDALIVPRADRTYDAVFELTPAEFDGAFREYLNARFGQ